MLKSAAAAGRSAPAEGVVLAQQLLALAHLLEERQTRAFAGPLAGQVEPSRHGRKAVAPDEYEARAHRVDAREPALDPQAVGRDADVPAIGERDVVVERALREAAGEAAEIELAPRADRADERLVETDEPLGQRRREGHVAVDEEEMRAGRGEEAVRELVALDDDVAAVERVILGADPVRVQMHDEMGERGDIAREHDAVSGRRRDEEAVTRARGGAFGIRVRGRRKSLCMKSYCCRPRPVPARTIIMFGCTGVAVVSIWTMVLSLAASSYQVTLLATTLEFWPPQRKS